MKSNIPRVQIPEFQAIIPESLLKNEKSGSTKWMLEQVSVMKQANQWQNKKIQDIYDYTRSMNGQLIELQKFKSDLLLQMENEHKISIITEENKKHTTKLYKIIALCFLTVVYPLFLTQWTTGGVSKILNFLW